MTLFVAVKNVRQYKMKILIWPLYDICNFSFLFLYYFIQESKLLIRVFVLYTLAIMCVHALVYFTLLCFAMMDVWSIIIYVGGFIWQEWVIWASARFLEHLVNGTSEEDDDYDFTSRRSSDDDRYSYKLWYDLVYKVIVEFNVIIEILWSEFVLCVIV